MAYNEMEILNCIKHKNVQPHRRSYLTNDLNKSENVWLTYEQNYDCINILVHV